MLEFAEFHTFCAGIAGIGPDGFVPKRENDAVGAGDSSGAMSSGRGPELAGPAMFIGERGICMPGWRLFCLSAPPMILN
jgi:hypothetical protein